MGRSAGSDLGPGGAGSRGIPVGAPHRTGARRGRRPPHPAQYAIREHHPARGGSSVSRRPRHGAPHQERHPLERHGHGRAPEQIRPRHRRTHFHLRISRHAARSGLQSFLSRAIWRPARRPNLLPGPRLARHLRARVPGRPPHRGAPAQLPPRAARHPGAVLLSAPLADARFLAFPHRLHGLGPHQFHLPGALHALYGKPRPDPSHAAQDLGVPRRWRNGRLDFNLAPNGFNCANSQCTVQVNFTPLAPGLRLGAIRFTDTNNNVLSTSYISGVGTASLMTFAPAVSQALPFTGLDHPLSLAVDAAGDVFAGDYGNRVLELPAGGGPATTLPFTGIGRAFGLAVDGAGDVFVADYYNQQVVELPAGGAAQVTLPLTGLQGPGGIAVDGSGDVFVSDLSNQVFELPAGGGTPLVIGSGWNNPRGLAVDSAGDLFVADSGSGRLLEVPSGSSQIVTVAGGFGSPVGIAVDAAGGIFVADAVNNVGAGRPGGGCPQAGCPTVGSGFHGPWAVALDGSGDLFIGDTNDSQVVEALRSQGPTLSFQSTAVGGTSSDSPQSVTVQNTGNANLAISAVTVGTNFAQTKSRGWRCLYSGP